MLVVHKALQAATKKESESSFGGAGTASLPAAVTRNSFSGIPAAQRAQEDEKALFALGLTGGGTSTGEGGSAKSRQNKRGAAGGSPLLGRPLEGEVSGLLGAGLFGTGSFSLGATPSNYIFGAPQDGAAVTGGSLFGAGSIGTGSYSPGAAPSQAVLSLVHHWMADCCSLRHWVAQ